MEVDAVPRSDDDVLVVYWKIEMAASFDSNEFLKKEQSRDLRHSILS